VTYFRQVLHGAELIASVVGGGVPLVGSNREKRLFPHGWGVPERTDLVGEPFLVKGSARMGDVVACVAADCPAEVRPAWVTVDGVVLTWTGSAWTGSDDDLEADVVCLWGWSYWILWYQEWGGGAVLLVYEKVWGDDPRGRYSRVAGSLEEPVTRDVV
jgi:hypothetical protein